MRTSPAYAITRRRGKSGTIRRLTGGTVDDDNLTRSDVFTDTVVRYLYKGDTRYSRLVRAEAAQQRVGDVTFIICLKDVEAVFTSLQTEDRIVFQGQTFEVVSSGIQDDGLVVTARVFDGS
jgi:hypothetical protein